MKILRKKKISDWRVSFVFYSGLVAVVALFGTVKIARVEAITANNFVDLKNAVGDTNEKNIDIKEDIPFIDVIVINRNNLIISGSKEGELAKFNGNLGKRFFLLEKNSKIELKNLHFNNGGTNTVKNLFKLFESDRNEGGGAISLNNGTGIILENVVLENNKNIYIGGAISSCGKDNNINTLVLRKTTFYNNESFGTGSEDGGGAIYAGSSNITFAGETKFIKNISSGNGGAIYSDGTVTEVSDEGIVSNNINILTFDGKTTFDGNESGGIGTKKGGGGAIYARSSKIIFGEDTEFIGNTSSANGGAICTCGKEKDIEDVNVEKSNEQEPDTSELNTLEFKGKAIFKENKINDELDGGAIYAFRSLLIFRKLAIFEKNSNKSDDGDGGAIYAFDSVSIEFNNGLQLVNNVTKATDSGAIYMYGLNSDRLVTITIVQKNPAVPTEFSGNRSMDGRQCAIYMREYSRLNFIIEENNNVDIFDTICGGGKLDNDNLVTVDGIGWFNLRRGGFIENVSLVNKGNIALIGGANELNLIDFTNSGTVKFEIFSDGRCAKIKADSMTLNAGTTLEVVATKGQYKAGKSYDILIVNKKEGENKNITINDLKNISLRSFQENLKIKEDFSENGRIYRIVVEEDINIKDNPVGTNLFFYLGALDSNQQNVDDVLTDIYLRNPNDKKLNVMLNHTEELGNHEDIKETLSQMSPQLLADVIGSDLIDIARQQVKRDIDSRLSYRSSKLANGMEDSTIGFTMGTILHLKRITLDFYGTIDSHFLKGNQGNEAKITKGAVIFRLSAKIIGELNLAANLSYGINNHTVGRNIEKLNEIAKSNFSTNTFAIVTAMEREFRISYLIFAPSLSLRASLLTHGRFSEKNAGILNLTVDSGSYRMLTGSLNLTVAINLARFRPFIVLGTSYLLEYSSPEISASFGEYPSSIKLKSRGVESGRLFGSMSLGFEYKLAHGLSFSLLGDCQVAGNYRSLAIGVAVGYLF
ncbi:MAG: autotransporter domain-containing protein [Rickettsiales bacterium]|jgi:predicted outer membrane repeat protein|nr:autotransporter domain-containing protein [Rickettsiales bacterium]